MTVSVTHQLKAPIKCAVDRGLGKLGFRCEHEKPAQDLQPPPGKDVPPL